MATGNGLTLPEGPFDLIYADPPWNFATWSATRQTKLPPYTRMTVKEIAALPVARLAAKDCVLVLWATQAQLPDAISVLEDWGFIFKTAGAWAKRSKTGKAWAFGTGYLLRSAAEFFLLGTRGALRSAVHDVRNLIVAPVREHSRKPEEMYENLERMFPQARKCELFATRRRAGWTSWGDGLK